MHILNEQKYIPLLKQNCTNYFKSPKCSVSIAALIRIWSNLYRKKNINQQTILEFLFYSKLNEYHLYNVKVIHAVFS